MRRKAQCARLLLCNPEIKFLYLFFRLGPFGFSWHKFSAPSVLPESLAGFLTQFRPRLQIETLISWKTLTLAYAIGILRGRRCDSSTGSRAIDGGTVGFSPQAVPEFSRVSSSAGDFAHEGPVWSDEGRAPAPAAVDLAVGADGADRWEVRRALRLGVLSPREGQVRVLLPFFKLCSVSLLLFFSTVQSTGGVFDL